MRYQHREPVTPVSYRPCAKCGGHRTPEGHDPCIPNLPGVMAACCGHGLSPGYVMFTDGRAMTFRLIEVTDWRAYHRRKIISALKARAGGTR